MNRILGPLTRGVVFALCLIIQVAWIQTAQTTPSPWLNLPLIILLWSSIQKTSPWVLGGAALIGLVIDLQAGHGFGIFVIAHVLASATVMISSVELLHKKGALNRSLIGWSGVLVYGLVWGVASHIPVLHFTPPPVLSWSLLIELVLLYALFVALQYLRPIWLMVAKPIQRYA